MTKLDVLSWTLQAPCKSHSLPTWWKEELLIFGGKKVRKISEKTQAQLYKGLLSRQRLGTPPQNTWRGDWCYRDIFPISRYAVAPLQPRACCGTSSNAGRFHSMPSVSSASLRGPSRGLAPGRFVFPFLLVGALQTKKQKQKKPTQPNPLPSSQGQIPCCHGYHSNFSCGTRNKKTSLRTEGYIMLALPPSPHSSLLATKSATSGIFNLG